MISAIFLFKKLFKFTYPDNWTLSPVNVRNISVCLLGLCVFYLKVFIRHTLVPLLYYPHPLLLSLLLWLWSWNSCWMNSVPFLISLGHTHWIKGEHFTHTGSYFVYLVSRIEMERFNVVMRVYVSLKRERHSRKVSV